MTLLLAYGVSISIGQSFCDQTINVIKAWDLAPEKVLMWKQMHGGRVNSYAQFRYYSSLRRPVHLFNAKLGQSVA